MWPASPKPYQHVDQAVGAVLATADCVAICTLAKTPSLPAHQTSSPVSILLEIPLIICQVFLLFLYFFF